MHPCHTSHSLKLCCSAVRSEAKQHNIQLLFAYLTSTGIHGYVCVPGGLVGASEPPWRLINY